MSRSRLHTKLARHLILPVLFIVQLPARGPAVTLTAPPANHPVLFFWTCLKIFNDRKANYKIRVHCSDISSELTPSKDSAIFPYLPVFATCPLGYFYLNTTENAPKSADGPCDNPNASYTRNPLSCDWGPRPGSLLIRQLPIAHSTKYRHCYNKWMPNHCN